MFPSGYWPSGYFATAFFVDYGAAIGVVPGLLTITISNVT